MSKIQRPSFVKMAPEGSRGLNCKFLQVVRVVRCRLIKKKAEPPPCKIISPDMKSLQEGSQDSKTSQD